MNKKIMGQYMTPQNVANWMARGIAEYNPQTVLEPSFGNGVFFRALHTYGLNAKLFGCELDKELFESGLETTRKLFADYELTNECFLTFYLANIGNKMDAIIGNPPFVSHLSTSDNFKQRAKQLCAMAGIKYSKMMNTWVLFVMASLMMLKQGGKLALVLPIDILTAAWAEELRKLFQKQKCRVTILETWEPMFPDVDQATCILLAQKGADQHTVKYLSLPSLDSIEPYYAWGLPGQNHGTNWTLAQLPEQVRSLLHSLPAEREVKRLGTLARISVPPPTGANKFFFVNGDTIHKYDLIHWTEPVFSSVGLCKSILYEFHDWQNDAADGKNVYLLSMPPNVVKHPKAKRYIDKYRAYNPQLSYKCSQHTPEWWCLPKGFTRPELFMPKRNGDVARLIRNEADVIIGDCCMKVEPKKQNIADRLAINFMNPLTMLTAELYGKRFGGGVLEMQPRSADELLVPWPKGDNDPTQLHTLSVMYKPEEVVRQFGRILLMKLMSSAEADSITNTWLKLRSRRLKGEQHDL